MTTRPMDLTRPADASWAYLEGQLHPSQGPLLQAFARESEDSVARWQPSLDLRYGPHPRATFDHYASPKPWRGTLAYLHAGFWQSRDKAQFRFVGPPFLALGIDVVLLNYPLCPDVTLSRIVDDVRAGIPAVLAHLSGVGRGGTDMVVMGHSAGGHLAVEMAMADWAARPTSPIIGIVPISGVYELAPLRATRLNDNLRLDEEEARRLSPLHRAHAPLPQAHFVVGGRETPEFRAQSEAMHGAWEMAGGASRLSIVADADHFSVLRELNEGGAIHQAVLDLFGRS